MNYHWLGRLIFVDIADQFMRGAFKMPLLRWLINGLICVWIAAVILLGSIGGILRTIIIFLKGPQPIDFNTLYLAARMSMRDPQSIYNVSALTALENAAQGAGSLFQVRDWAPPFAYPPFVAVAIRPLAALPHETAVWIWLILNLTLLLLSLPMMLKLIQGLNENPDSRRLNSRIGVLAFLLFVPAFEAVMLGQVGPILLFLVTASLVLLRRSDAIHDFEAGTLIGLAAMIKIFPGIFLIYFALRRRWTAFAGGVIALFITAAIGLLGSGGLQTGWRLSWNYFTSGLFQTYSARLTFLQPGNQAITAWSIRLLGDSAPVHTLTLLVVALIFAVTWMIILRKFPSMPKGSFLFEYAMVSLFFLLVPSTVCSHAFIIALLPIELLAGMIDWRQGSSLKLFTAFLGLAYLLLVISSYADWLQWPIFRTIPFGLAGVFILWGLLTWKLRASPGKAMSG